ncbi:hypothetical protein [Nocardioides dongxiaopingii]|uniref:hypothetical protein n=1 Tax=Nocardioides dongxiaopingii TaxID=2576036 RepID=UPI0010C76461|nr:hypothetical protein [Nocardioides dongxiaopingii]
MSVLLAGGLVLWGLVDGDPDEDAPYRASAPTAAPAVVEPAGAAQALQSLARALEDGDRSAATALALPDDAAAAARLGDLVDAARAIRLDDVTLRYVDEEDGVTADGTWSAAVDATWTYGGFDEVPTTAEVRVSFRAADGRVAVTGLGGTGDDTGGTGGAGGGGTGLRTPVWMSGPVAVAREDDVLVVAAAGRGTEPYLRRARAAAPAVADVVRDWRPRLVVEVPADTAGLEQALGVEAGYYEQIAAVTGTGGTATGATTDGGAVHVYVNPDVFDGLGRVGQQVVLTHEATHVATAAPASGAPTWLVEGFADYVALRDTTLPLTRTAGQVADLVRADGLPAALPDGAEFDTRGPHLGAAYEAAWLVCVTLAERGGQDALVDFYTRVGEGDALDVALRSGFDWDEADLVRAWRDRLAGLPGAARG